MIDLYFEKEYGKIYEKIENGKIEIFKYNSSYGSIYHMFLKRKINTIIDGCEWYDLVTPYGYGGPVITSVIGNRINSLLEGFEKSFSNYCLENNIVSEFIRFHPLIDNAKNFENIYEIQYLRKTVGTKINSNDDPIKTEFSKSARKTIQKSLKLGLSYKITKSPNDIHNFKEIYYSTMDRNQASEYYYFDDDYFNRCLKYFKKNILLIEVFYEDKVIASAFYFIYNKIIHAHLSGTLQEYLYLSPAYIIKYATAVWAKENDIELIHYGGGITNSEDDSLYLYKRKFTKSTEFKYYIGKKVWNKDIYDKLCVVLEAKDQSDYFPLYRSKY